MNEDFPYLGVVGYDKRVIAYNDTHYYYVDVPNSSNKSVYVFREFNTDGGFNWYKSDVESISGKVTFNVFEPTLMEECEYSLDNENWFPCTVVNFKPLIVYTPNDKEVTMIQDSVIAPSGIKFREKEKDERQEFIDKTILVVQDHQYDECIAHALWEAGYRLPTTNK